MHRNQKKKKRPNRKQRRIAQSAKSGRFVSKKFAAENPETTFVQEVDLSKHRHCHGE
jgi:hypothetical protein